MVLIDRLRAARWCPSFWRKESTPAAPPLAPPGPRPFRIAVHFTLAAAAVFALGFLLRSLGFSELGMATFAVGMATYLYSAHVARPEAGRRKRVLAPGRFIASGFMDMARLIGQGRASRRAETHVT